MTERIKGFVITLDRDMREDDVVSVITALRMVRCVANVAPIPVSNYDDHVIRTRVVQEHTAKLRELIAKWNEL